MPLLERTKEICRIYDIRPARSKGQNFLINEAVYDRIVEAAEIAPTDTVLEVGPGLGFLTAKLSKKARRVISVELDDKLAKVLKTGLDSQGVENVEVINENVLDINIGEILDSVIARSEATKQPNGKELDSSVSPSLSSRNDRRGDHAFACDDNNYKIVANLPYNITSVFLRKFLSEAELKPETTVLMLQKEVAERITAKPGDMSLLAVSVQFYAEGEIIQIVPRNDFWPAPAVDSAIIRLKVKSEKSKVDEKSFFRLAKIGFSAKRKMLKNNLANGYHIDQEEAEKRIVKQGLNPKVRAQELSINDWARLLGEFA